ncbi:MAG: hypothetical protein LUQ65_10925, partial [Candidatus Helarchaeota archaeon]|nr:hypothetical protein [Candidatus Helarchaeota archaeon]
MSVKIMGLNTGHDGGCCLLIDGIIKYAISEERLNRRKYSSGWLNSLNYCLEASNLRLSDIDLVVFSSYGRNLPLGFDGGLHKYGFSNKK